MATKIQPNERPSYRKIAKAIGRSHQLVSNMLHQRGSYSKKTEAKMYKVIEKWQAKQQKKADAKVKSPDKS